jgi:hypothetical protein
VRSLRAEVFHAVPNPCLEDFEGLRKIGNLRVLLRALLEAWQEGGLLGRQDGHADLAHLNRVQAVGYSFRAMS